MFIYTDMMGFRDRTVAVATDRGWGKRWGREDVRWRGGGAARGG